MRQIRPDQQMPTVSFSASLPTRPKSIDNSARGNNIFQVCRIYKQIGLQRYRALLWQIAILLYSRLDLDHLISKLPGCLSNVNRSQSLFKSRTLPAASPYFLTISSMVSELVFNRSLCRLSIVASRSPPWLFQRFWPHPPQLPAWHQAVHQWPPPRPWQRPWGRKRQEAVTPAG